MDIDLLQDITIKIGILKDESASNAFNWIPAKKWCHNNLDSTDWEYIGLGEFKFKTPSAATAFSLKFYKIHE